MIFVTYNPIKSTDNLKNISTDKSARSSVNPIKGFDNPIKSFDNLMKCSDNSLIFQPRTPKNSRVIPQ